MKGKDLRQVQAEYTKVLCMVCEKACDGYYGHWGNVGTCSRSCEHTQSNLPIRERYNHPSPVR